MLVHQRVSPIFCWSNEDFSDTSVQRFVQVSQAVRTWVFTSPMSWFTGLKWSCGSQLLKQIKNKPLTAWTQPCIDYRWLMMIICDHSLIIDHCKINRCFSPPYHGFPQIHSAPVSHPLRSPAPAGRSCAPSSARSPVPGGTPPWWPGWSCGSRWSRHLGWWKGAWPMAICWKDEIRHTEGFFLKIFIYIYIYCIHMYICISTYTCLNIYIYIYLIYICMCVNSYLKNTFL